MGLILCYGNVNLYKGCVYVGEILEVSVCCAANWHYSYKIIIVWLVWLDI